MRRFSTFACLLGLFLTTVLSPSAHAAWPRDPYLGGVPIATGSSSQYLDTAVSDGAGGVIFAWSEVRGADEDIYVQRISASGVPLWTANGVLVCNAAGIQYGPKLLPDLAGGAIVAWSDLRGASSDVYAQRVNANGVAQWTTNGVVVSNAANSQQLGAITRDGSTGAILTWTDQRGLSQDIYAQRINSSGTSIWTASGVPVCTAAGGQYVPELVSDGGGGAIITWMDVRSASNDVYAQRLNSSGTAQWTTNGLPISVTSGGQDDPKIASDGTGGAIITWYDSRGGGLYDIYGQHVTNAGSTTWTTDGALLVTAANDQFGELIVSDGSGGIFMAWMDDRSASGDFDVYAQRISGAGASLWTANGVALCTVSGDQTDVSLVADGLGGCIVAWQDRRNALAASIYAQRLSASGVIQWPSNGNLICSTTGGQFTPQACANGAGGAIVGWSDIRAYTNADIYCQRVDRYGQLGDAEPVITSVSDVKNDQGGFVKLVWNASYLDVDPTYGITEYRVFRSAPGPLLANGAPASSRATTTDSDEAVREGKLLLVPNGAQVTSWEFVGTQAAEAFASYSRIVATTADSVGGSNPRTYFLVEARASTSISSDRWSSAPDSGYSVDNLAPAAPAPLTGQYALGTTQLHWNRNTEADLAGYKLYRGSSVSFVPGPANFVAQLPDTGAADAAGAPYVYKLTAVDVHGNESPVATLIPSGTLGVGDGPARAALSFAAPSPNPARGSATLRYSLSARGHAKLALFDAAGRRVATVADGVMEAGEHSVAFALRDDAGRELPAGLYLARLEAEGRVLTRRIAAVR